MGKYGHNNDAAFELYDGRRFTFRPPGTVYVHVYICVSPLNFLTTHFNVATSLPAGERANQFLIAALKTIDGKIARALCEQLLYREAARGLHKRLRGSVFDTARKPLLPNTANI